MFENVDWKFVAIVSVLVILVAALIYVFYTENSKEPFFGAGSEDSFGVPGDNAFLPEESKPSELLAASNAGKVLADPNNEDKQGPYTISQQNADTTYDGQNGIDLPADLFPQNQLKPQDLPPTETNSVWAKVNPAGQGDLADKNFLESGYHVGINTVGQSLRNANYQLRSDPPNPQMKVSPWMQSTIEPDSNRRKFEIGSA